MTTTLAQRAVKLTNEQIQNAFEDLRQEIITGSDEHLVEYLETMADLAANARKGGMFRRWSARNFMYLEAQRRMSGESHLGLYAGRAQWASIDRKVNAGARAKKIWAFSPKKDRRDVSDDAEAEAPRMRAGFALVDVYDWSDTTSTDPTFIEPNWAAPLAVGDQATLEMLAASSPVPVEFIDMASRSENGYLCRTGIVVDASTPLGNQLSTLAHELGHFELGHLDALGSTAGTDQAELRAKCEQEAALVQWLVMKMLGLDEAVGNDVTAAAANYLRTWIDDTGAEIPGRKRRAKLLDARLGAAMPAAEAIVDRYLAHINTAG